MLVYYIPDGPSFVLVLFMSGGTTEDAVAM